MNKKQKSLTNKGFSLVELIIVIAIMAVLVGVLAPQFLKYVEQSRRSTDIQSASSLQTAFLTAIADSEIKGTAGTAATPVIVTDESVTKPSSVSAYPKVTATLSGIDTTGFYVYYDATSGVCNVCVKYTSGGTTKYYNLTDSKDATDYKALN